jgi:hypothetical protein
MVVATGTPGGASYPGGSPLPARTTPRKPFGQDPIEVEELEEVEDEPARPTPRRLPRRKRKPLLDDEDRDGPWLITLGLAIVCFFFSFVIFLVVNDFKGVPDTRRVSGFTEKMMNGVFFLLVGLIAPIFSIFGVKNKIMRLRWGIVLTGVPAVVVGMFFTMFFAVLGGFGLYVLVMTVIEGH